MRNIPNVNVFNEWNDYYESENLQNTNFSSFEDINPRRPDAYIGFNNSILFTPQSYFNDPDEIIDSDWYD